MDIREAEEFFDLKKRKEKRQRKRHRKYILSEICKIVFLLFIWIVSMMVIVLLSEAAPAKALLVYECIASGGVVLIVSFWLDKPRRKK